jgi:hypothetical protein
MKRAMQLLLVLLSIFTLASVVLAQQQNETKSAPDALLRLLQSKGVLSEEEANSVSHASSPTDYQQRLAKMLLGKGVITQEEYDKTISEPVAATDAATTTNLIQQSNSKFVTAAMVTTPVSVQSIAATKTQAPSKAPEPNVIPAIAPLRFLPITIPKKDGLLPDIKLPSGASVRPYGFFKASAVNQTTLNGGPIFGSNDFPDGPLLFGGDTGPDADPQTHIRDRMLRLGVDFEWPDPSKNLTLTGKLEFDFEGNYTNVNNRNISSNRSSQPSLRLGWVRLDSKIKGLPWFAQFGQDWSIFGSSTLMDIFETTGFGFAQGNLYERMPMFRTGVQFGKGDFKVQPEIAIALSSFGEPGLDVDERTRFGSRVGPESNQPETQGRIVFQFPLSKAPGVVPAQIIFSYDHAQRREIVPAGNMTALPIAVRNAFPTGVALTEDRNAWTAEMQLPTSWVTVVGKYYHGGDLRYFFQGQFNDVFTDLAGATPLGTALSFANRSIPFGIVGTTVVVGSLQPIRGQGGFVQIGIPLSRVFHADPVGRDAGWTTYFTYGVDSAFARDVVRTGGNGLLRTDHGSYQLRYKLNKWWSFVQETTYLDTRTADAVTRLYRGLPVHTVHAWRNEFGTIVTF